MFSEPVFGVKWQSRTVAISDRGNLGPEPKGLIPGVGLLPGGMAPIRDTTGNENGQRPPNRDPLAASDPVGRYRGSALPAVTA